MLGVPYSHPIDMWSFGCIMVELITGEPIFRAWDENELVEMLRVRISLPPEHMLRTATKKHQFFDPNGQLIRSKKSRIPPDTPESSLTIRNVLEERNVED